MDILVFLIPPYPQKTIDKIECFMSNFSFPIHLQIMSFQWHWNMSHRTVKSYFQNPTRSVAGSKKTKIHSKQLLAYSLDAYSIICMYFCMKNI